MNVRAWLLLALLPSWAMAADDVVVPLRPTPAQLAEQAEARRGEFKLNFEIPKVENEEAVKKLAEEGRARGAAELERMARAYELQQQLAGEDPKAQEQARKTPLAGRLVLAVSSSMPEQMLRDYFAQLSGVEEAVVVLRGFIGGATKVKPTGMWMEKLTRTVPADFKKAHHRLNIVIDPILYHALGIERVPAVVWLPGVQDIRHCNQETYAAATVVYGAVSVAAAAQEINKNGGSVPDTLVARLEGRPWQ